MSVHLDAIADSINDAYDAALSADRSFAFTSMKTFNGREGEGYSATVTRDGKKVGEVVDEGNGGAPYLRLMHADREAFLAEAQSFFTDADEWMAEETYCSILSMAADINRKRAIVVATSRRGQRLGDGVYLAITGGEKALSVVARYLLSPKSGVADSEPRIWVKAQGRFVSAADLA